MLDLGAGTGKLTRTLVALGHDVVAVEPSAPMLAQLRRALPHVEALEGGAEAIPVADARADAALAGQAFHWFDPTRALPEIQRVLCPAGVLGVVWNVLDEAQLPPPERVRVLAAVGELWDVEAGAEGLGLSYIAYAYRAARR